jgi:hypothetical protein
VKLGGTNGNFIKLGSKLVVRPRVAEASGGGCVPEVSPSRQHTRRQLTTTTPCVFVHSKYLRTRSTCVVHIYIAKINIQLYTCVNIYTHIYLSIHIFILVVHVQIHSTSMCIHKDPSYYFYLVYPCLFSFILFHHQHSSESSFIVTIVLISSRNKICIGRAIRHSPAFEILSRIAQNNLPPSQCPAMCRTAGCKSWLSWQP